MGDCCAEETVRGRRLPRLLLILHVQRSAQVHAIHQLVFLTTAAQIWRRLNIQRTPWETCFMRLFLPYTFMSFDHRRRRRRCSTPTTHCGSAPVGGTPCSPLSAVPSLQALNWKDHSRPGRMLSICPGCWYFKSRSKTPHEPPGTSVSRNEGYPNQSGSFPDKLVGETCWGCLIPVGTV
jgi:hypothetical protein